MPRPSDARTLALPQHPGLYLALVALALLSAGCPPELVVQGVENECVADPSTLSIVDGVEIRTGNKVDDDGDGVIDEFCSCNYDKLDAGVCLSGVVDARQPICRRPQNHYPVEVTLCDKLDNDCDGLADEQCKCNVEENSVGVCALGRIMSDGACLAPEFYELDEALCDGYDNDCDNQTDENCMICDFQGNLQGVCRYGRPDSTSGLCLPPLNFALVEQECGSDPLAGDGVDNDCDGFVDEGCACAFQGSVFGVCSVGKRAAPGDCLAPDNYEAEEETCDGLDNDCDGFVDEECSNVVIDNCKPEDERCDGIDNDCDGITDETCACNYAQNTTGVCSNGILSDRSGLCLPPQNFEPLETSCDGIDNDCNGQVDERCSKDFIKIASGDAHTCGILEDGQARCWGRNAWDLHKVPEAQTFKKLDAGRYHTCGISSGDEIFCWGGNDFGQAVSNMKNALDIATGSYHSCGLSSAGAPVCWGSDLHGQSSPPGSGYTQLTAGEYHTCGLRSNGVVECWGLNDDGQSTPPQGSTFTKVVAGHFHTCGLRADGGVECWGANGEGESTPPTSATTYIDLIASEQYTCAIAQSKQLVCWGKRLGALEAPLEAFDVISGSSKHACGITANKSVLCWGDNTFRQQAPDSNVYTQIASGRQNTCALQRSNLAICWGADPVINDPPPPTMTGVSVGISHACGIRADNARPICWGDDTLGQSSPPADLTLEKIATGESHSCGLKFDGTIVCWGDDTDGKLAAPEGTFSTITASDNFTCALGIDQRVSCWGKDLGVGNLDAPVGLFERVTAGPRNVCAINLQSTAECWGDETFNIQRTSRTPYLEVGVGLEFACGITEIGQLECWGATSKPGVLSPPTTDRFTKLAIGEHAAALSRENFILSW